MIITYMNQDLTVKTLLFTGIYNDAVAGSLRRDVSRGPTLPTEISIRNKDIVDNKTKKSAHQTSLKVAMTIAGADGNPVVVSGNLVTTVPDDTAVSSTNITDVIAILAEMIKKDGTTHLDLDDDIFVSRAQ